MFNLLFQVCVIWHKLHSVPNKRLIANHSSLQTKVFAYAHCIVCVIFGLRGIRLLKLTRAENEFLHLMV